MNILAQFEEYLTKNKGVSSKTLRNYRADLNHFLKWADKTVEEIIPNFSPSLVGQYKGFHLETSVPNSTANRRLSTLRNFSRFLITHGLIEKDPTEVIENMREDRDQGKEFDALMGKFKKHLEEQGLSKSTLKNYVSDVRAFGSWLQNQ